MSGPSNDALMVESARARLASGASARMLFLELLAQGTGSTDAAIAVCVACGSPREDAEIRLRTFDGLWEQVESGEEGDAADLLVMLGYFEPDARLDEPEQTTAASLRAALSTVPGVPSGYAVTLFTDLRTGRLAKAFLQLESLGTKRWADHNDFWVAMHRAGETLPEDHSDVTAAKRRCCERAAFGGPDTSATE